MSSEKNAPHRDAHDKDAPDKVAPGEDAPDKDAPDRDALVRAQYQTHPYPARDPRDEATRLIAGSPSHLLEIDHYLFAGARDWSRPFRALVAGGGTGDATVMLAQQLHDAGCPAEIVHLDLSAQACDIARARLAMRKLTNVQLHQGSLLDLPAVAPGPFDYIDCCGVLHHLDDPPAGLAALASVLAPDGGMGLMVYGAQGRTGVYALQAALRELAPAALAPPERIKIARRLLQGLPPTNWFKRNPFLGDHQQGGDAGIYDLLLHARDRPYDVAGFDALIGGAGLAMVTLLEPARYQPQTYLNDPILLKQMAKLNPIQLAAIAETLAGNITKHAAYATWPTRARACVAHAESGDWIPLLRDLDGAALGAQFKPGGSFSADLDGVTWRAALPNLASPILARIDGQRSLAQIHGQLQALDVKLDWPGFKLQFDRLFAVFNAANRLFLRRARS